MRSPKGNCRPISTRRSAAAMVHAFVSGSLRDMLFLPEATDFGKHAEQMVEGMFDALRLSPALRTGNRAAPAARSTRSDWARYLCGNPARPRLLIRRVDIAELERRPTLHRRDPLLRTRHRREVRLQDHAENPVNLLPRSQSPRCSHRAASRLRRAEIRRQAPHATRG